MLTQIDAQNPYEYGRTGKVHVSQEVDVRKFRTSLIMSSRLCTNIPRRSMHRRIDRPFLSVYSADANMVNSRPSRDCLSVNNSRHQLRLPPSMPNRLYEENSTSLGLERTDDYIQAEIFQGVFKTRREFDTIPPTECLSALRELRSYPDSGSTQKDMCSHLRKQLICRLVYLIVNEAASPELDVEILDALLDVYDDSDSVKGACNRILSRSFDWLNNHRVFWKLRGKPDLTPSVTRILSEPPLISQLLSRHSSCLMFKSRLLDLMIFSGVPGDHLRQVIASICETIDQAPRESLQPKPLYTTLIEVCNIESSDFWNLAESKRLISTMLAHKCVPKVPGLATIALSNGIIQTGGIRVHRSPVVYQILTDTLTLYPRFQRTKDLLRICTEYKLPSTSASIFFPRQKASAAASAFASKLISQSIETDLPNFAKLVSIPSVEIKSSLCLWNLINSSIVQNPPRDPIDCITILLAAERAKQSCPVYETINQSLFPRAILGIRKYLQNGGNIRRVINELNFFPSGKVARRIVEELIEHVVARIRLGSFVLCEDVVGILKIANDAKFFDRTFELQKYLVSQIVSAGDQVDRPSDFWVDILRVTTSDHLAEFAVTKLNVSSLSIEEMIGVSKWIHEDNAEWKDRALSLVLPEDKEGVKTVENLTACLRRKHERLEQYAEFPDGKGDGNIAAAFCGIFLSLGLSTHFLGFSN
jgi:hypothetical protein